MKQLILMIFARDSCVCVYEVHIYVECQEREQFEEAKIY